MWGHPHPSSCALGGWGTVASSGSCGGTGRLLYTMVFWDWRIQSSWFTSFSVVSQCSEQQWDSVCKLLLLIQNCIAKHIKQFSDCSVCHLYSYTLKCQTRSDFGKVTMEFDLEVCQLSKTEVVGIRRQRLKGDAWVYKRLIEDILSSCQVWWGDVCVEEAAVPYWGFNRTVLERSVQRSCSLPHSQLYLKNLSFFFGF